MFTGIVQALGKIEAIERGDGDVRMTFSCGELATTALARGDSIALNGVCLTVTDIAGGRISVDISGETLGCTTLADIQCGDPINLEKALLPTTALSGHFVSGHVDGVGIVNKVTKDGSSIRLCIKVPGHLARYIATKGSVSVDGVSLTVNKIQGSEFEVNIIPHTSTVTILGDYSAGKRVNIEVDIIARYLERLLNAVTGRDKPESTVTRAFLIEHGYIKDSNTD